MARDAEEVAHAMIQAARDGEGARLPLTYRDYVVPESKAGVALLRQEAEATARLLTDR